MGISFRNYQPEHDYERVDEFLLAHYQPGNADGNWLEPAWEYSLYHPSLDRGALDRIGLWEADGRIAAVALYEDQLGVAFFQRDPAYAFLYPQMLEYAEAALSVEEDGKRTLGIFISDFDTDLQILARVCGYAKTAEIRPMYGLAIPNPFPNISLPPGYRLQSLADEPDWGKVQHVLWRGFDHDGEPAMDAATLEERRAMFDTPTASRDLKIVVKAPNGDFAAFCGMFHVPECRYAYVEPVATDPDYRRMGLGRAAVLEGIRRCAALGAEVAYVGSNQLFYQSMGFQKLFHHERWQKIFP